MLKEICVDKQRWNERSSAVLPNAMEHLILLVNVQEKANGEKELERFSKQFMISYYSALRQSLDRDSACV